MQCMAPRSKLSSCTKNNADLSLVDSTVLHSNDGDWRHSLMTRNWFLPNTNTTKPRCRSDRGCCGGKIKCPSGFERLRKKSFPEMFCATGPLEAPGLSSQVAMQTLYYTGRDKGDQETPLVSEATSATGIYAPSQPIFVILFIAHIHYLIHPSIHLSRKFVLSICYVPDIIWERNNTK